MAWFEKVSDAMYQVLCCSFGIDPSSQEGMKRFAPAYIFTATTPQADRNADVCYYDIRQTSEPGFQYTEKEYANKDSIDAKVKISRNIPITVLFTFYGPNADDDSEIFWTMCQQDIDSGGVRAILHRNQIVISGYPEFPVGMDQIEGTFIRRRCDVRLNLVLYDEKIVPYGTVEHIPDRGIYVQY